MGHQDYFLAPLLGSIALFVSSLENYIVRCSLLSIVGKTTDPKVPILPSRTRQGTTLNTAVALDSPSVINKLVTLSHASHAITAESDTMSDEFDDASTVLETSGSLGSFLDSQIAKAKEIERAEIFEKVLSTPKQSPERSDFDNDKSDYLDDTYVTLDVEFFKDYMSHETVPNPETFKKLLEKHSMKNKFIPDPEFAKSRVDIKDK